MSARFLGIAPHGEIEGGLATAMEELARRFDGGTLVVLTPHNVHVEGHFAVVTAARVGDYEVDRALALRLVDAIRAAGLPVVGVSYGGNDATQAEHPIDWGTEVPLRWLEPERVVVIAPARDLSLEAHVELGRVLASDNLSLSLLASADHGHAHEAEGPYGFHPAAAEYDRRFCELAAAGDFLPLAELVEDAKADSLWQLLILQGAAGGRGFELLAYDAPGYYGMAVAVAT